MPSACAASNSAFKALVSDGPKRNGCSVMAGRCSFRPRFLDVLRCVAIWIDPMLPHHVSGRGVGRGRPCKPSTSAVKGGTHTGALRLPSLGHGSSGFALEMTSGGACGLRLSTVHDVWQ